VANGDFEIAVEREPSAARGAAIEAKHELVKVGLHVRLVDRTLRLRRRRRFCGGVSVSKG
jgi:hypothetical protein